MPILTTDADVIQAVIDGQSAEIARLTAEVERLREALKSTASRAHAVLSKV